MPELPEVEITRQGISPAVVGRTIQKVVIRNRQLRWPIPKDIEGKLLLQTIQQIQRRGKYILFDCGSGFVILHLGMSGSLCYRPTESAYKKHDHFILDFDSGVSLRLCDPRRFGCVLWSQQPLEHPLLRDLGPEPLSEQFSADYLYRMSRKRKVALKNFIMNSKVVVGIGNIYASEALFESGIRPGMAAAKLSKSQAQSLVSAAKLVLQNAIAAGGTTLRDFSSANGKAGYFQQQLKVYGRKGEACLNCGNKIRSKLIGQRSSFYCPHCQK